MQDREISKFASVDIGSNAIRLLFCNVYDTDEGPYFKKAELIRFPLRLGEESFLRGSISEKTIQNLCKVMNAFRLMIEAHQVISYRVCATSAMREASNSKEVLAAVKKNSGINIEVIDGRLEAELIYSNHIAEHLDHNNSYLYIDVGGGSTELTMFDKGVVDSSGSFNVGTIRLLHDKVPKEQWKDFKEQVRKMTESHRSIVAIGSGGNINKIFRLAGKKDSKELSFSKLKECYDMVSSYSYDDRIRILKLNPDRADVIIPAFRIFNAIMKSAGIEKIIVPQVGLVDGIAHRLYEEYQGEQVNSLRNEAS